MVNALDSDLFEKTLHMKVREARDFHGVEAHLFYERLLTKRALTREEAILHERYGTIRQQYLPTEQGYNLEVLFHWMFEMAHPVGPVDPTFVGLTQEENHNLFDLFDEVWYPQDTTVMLAPRQLLRCVEGLMMGKNPGKLPSYRIHPDDSSRGDIVLTLDLLTKIEQEELGLQILVIIGDG